MFSCEGTSSAHICLTDFNYQGPTEMISCYNSVAGLVTHLWASPFGYSSFIYSRSPAAFDNFWVTLKLAATQAQPEVWGSCCTPHSPWHRTHGEGLWRWALCPSLSSVRCREGDVFRCTHGQSALWSEFWEQNELKPSSAWEWVEEQQSSTPGSLGKLEFYTSHLPGPLLGESHTSASDQ